MDIQSKDLAGAFQLYPMIIPGWRDAVLPAGVAHGGIPQSIYQEPKGLLMVIDPQTTLSQAMAAYDSVVVWLNGEQTSVGTIIQPGEEGDRIALYLPPGLLMNGINHLFYRWTRSSGNFEDSKPILDVLYHDPAPGYPAPAGIVVTHPARVGPTEAAQGVAVTFGISFPRPYDKVTLTVGTWSHTITVADPAQPITLKLTATDFQQIGDNPQMPIKVRVVDQLGNSNVSATTFMDIHASQSRNVVAFLNGPYRVAAGGRVKDVELSLTQEGQGTAGTISVILPAGTLYPDGTGGARNFPTRADGTLTVEGIKGTNTPGTYTLTASSGGSTATESLRVTEYGHSDVIAVGPNIRDITCSPDGARVYVAPVNHTSMAVIDTEKTIVERYIPLHTNGWVHHVLSRDGKRAFGGSNQDQKMYVLDIERSAIIASFPVGKAPFNVALNQDESLAFVSNMYDASVDVIDLQKLQVIKRIPVGIYPYQCVAHPDGKFMYLCVRDSKSIVVIDVQTLRVVRSIRLNSTPLHLAITPDGNSIFVNVFIDLQIEDILQVNAYTGAVIRTIRFNGLARGVVLNHAGTQAFCCSPQTGTVSIIDIASGVVRTVRVGRWPLSIAVSPDDSLGYVSCQLDGTVHIISLQS